MSEHVLTLASAGELLVVPEKDETMTQNKPEPFAEEKVPTFQMRLDYITHSDVLHVVLGYSTDPVNTVIKRCDLICGFCIGNYSCPESRKPLFLSFFCSVTLSRPARNELKIRVISLFFCARALK